MRLFVLWRYFFFSLSSSFSVSGRAEWAVRIICDESCDAVADRVASDIDLVNSGRIGLLSRYYRFAVGSLRPFRSDPDAKRSIERSLMSHDLIEWFFEQTSLRRFERSFDDPLFGRQWHLHNARRAGFDLNVSGLWANNITGSGVTVCVVDDGIQWRNPDLRDNYDDDGSWDFFDGDADPTPVDDQNDSHGTRCAGEIAAAANSVCGVGVAYRAKVSGARVLGDEMNDSLEASAFNVKMTVNDVYSCSWGPADDGRTLDGPRFLTRLALERGVEVGRRGLGAIYVVASGNGALNGDDCNFDGYANSIYTVTIGAVDERGEVPFYSEGCSCLLAVSFSGGASPTRNIVTTDVARPSSLSFCTSSHSGTSASAPLAAGVVSLALQVNPCLSWRDLQYLFALTSRRLDGGNASWIVNSVGLHHSRFFGFGLIDAWRFVNAAKAWVSVPSSTTFSSEKLSLNASLKSSPLILRYRVSSSMLAAYRLISLEHVQVSISLNHPRRGRVSIRLRCPSGTESLLAPPRHRDNSSDGFRDWFFSTVRCWGEDPVGKWLLSIRDVSGELNEPLVVSWRLLLRGTWLTRAQFDRRRRLVAESASGNHLGSNYVTNPSCDALSVSTETEISLSEDTLRILCAINFLLLLVTVFGVTRRYFG